MSQDEKLPLNEYIRKRMSRLPQFPTFPERQVFTQAEAYAMARALLTVEWALGHTTQLPARGVHDLVAVADKVTGREG